MTIKSNKAFTMLETLVTVFIATAILAGIYSTFLLGNKSWAYYSKTISKKQNVRRAFLWMRNELREAKDIFIVEEKGSLVLNFYRPGKGLVTYSWKDAGENAFRIIRKSQQDIRILANEIGSIKFKQLTSDEIFFEVSAVEGGNIKLSKNIALRYKTKKFRTKQDEVKEAE